MNITLFVVLLFAFSASNARAESFNERAGGDRLVDVSSNDPAMAEAVTKARAGLPRFLEAAAHPPQATDGYAVKVGLGPVGGKEFFWIAPFTVADGKLTGRLANKPERVKGYVEGQTIVVPASEITDWVYFHGARMVGNFSACALLTHEPPLETKRYEATYNIDCKAPDTP